MKWCKMTEAISWIGLRVATLRGGSFQVSIHPDIVRKIWNRGAEESFPVCYIKLGDRIVIEDFKNVQSSPGYPREIKTHAARESSPFLEGRLHADLKSLKEQLVKGRISQETYNQILDKLFRKYKARFEEFGLDFGRKFRAGGVRASEFFLAFDNLKTKERSEELNELVERVREVRKIELETLSLIKELETRSRRGEISKEVYVSLSNSYEQELSAIRDCLQKIKFVLS